MHLPCHVDTMQVPAPAECALVHANTAQESRPRHRSLALLPCPSNFVSIPHTVARAYRLQRRRLVTLWHMCCSHGRVRMHRPHGAHCAHMLGPAAAGLSAAAWATSQVLRHTCTSRCATGLGARFGGARFGVSRTVTDLRQVLRKCEI